VATALSREAGARGFELDAGGIGDIVVCGDRDTVLGKAEAYHDLGQLGGVPLRSHGGLDESTVPMMVNRPLGLDHAKRLGSGHARNYDLFDMILNGARSS
jgi:phosphonoacetate hydrolase